MTYPRLLFLGFLWISACGKPVTDGGLAVDAGTDESDVVFAAQDVDTSTSGLTDSGSTTDAKSDKDTSVVDVQDGKVIDIADSQTTIGDCSACLTDSECASGWFCAQFQGSSYCAKDCSTKVCSNGHACTPASSTAGDQLKVCVPLLNPCSGTVSPPDVSGSDASGGETSSDSGSLICGSLVGPDVASCCTCASGKTCAVNGCYGGWFCNKPTCKCHPAPNASSCGAVDAGSTDTGSNDTGGSKDIKSPDSVSTQSIGPTGGTLNSLDFAIVGDTRPPAKDDLKGYPTSVITQIYQDVENEKPSIPFVITTGDYQFSSPNGNTAAPQFDLYLGAQAQYSGTVFHTMGNHECTGAVISNCGTGNADGTPTTYKTFMQKLMVPLGLNEPWYVVNFKAADGSWTAKFVHIAANAWSSTQATWLDNAMSKATTYTFVVRHEGTLVTDAPGVKPSAAIIAKYPYTLLLVGHTHTFDYYVKEREVVTGNGGAPLATGVNYGYTVLRQRADKAIVVTALDYVTHATIQTFVVKPDGSPTK